MYKHPFLYLSPRHSRTVNDNLNISFSSSRLPAVHACTEIRSHPDNNPAASKAPLPRPACLRCSTTSRTPKQTVHNRWRGHCSENTAFSTFHTGETGHVTPRVRSDIRPPAIFRCTWIPYKPNYLKQCQHTLSRILSYPYLAANKGYRLSAVAITVDH